MFCRILWKSSRRIAIVTAAVSIITLAAAAPSGAYIDGDEVIQPPTTGEYAYGEFQPGAKGFPAAPSSRGTASTTYVDPIFDTTVRRLTDEYGDGTSAKASNSDIYSKNGFWSADGTLMFHNTASGKTIIDTKTGASVSVDGGLYDYKGFDASFAPTDAKGGPYHWYYFSGSTLRQYVITIVPDEEPYLRAFDDPVPVKDFKAFRARTLGLLGGSVDWIDNTGRYIVLNLDGKVRVWNKESDTLYSGSVGAAGADWIGISPDGNFVITSTDKGFLSYAIDHGARKLTTKGVLFWTLCGGHGDLVTATDGKTYMVTFDCYGEATAPYDKPAIYAVNVAPTTSASGRTETSRTAQRTSNKRLIQLEWYKSGDGHVTGVSNGSLRNWVFVSLESAASPNDAGDIFERAVDSTWWDRPYMQEIVMANVVTCEVRRLAHHRSRSIEDSYYYQPRVSAGWGSGTGVTVAWASNFGLKAAPDPDAPGFHRYADIYAIDVPGDVPDKKVCP